MSEHIHNFEEEYYGIRCTICDLFYPYGSEPWLPDPEPNPDYYCQFCGKDYEEFGDLGCAYCDVRVRN